MARDPVDLQGARLDAQARRAIDLEIEAVLIAAIAFARTSPEPDPAGALDHLYATGLRPRSGDGA
jgi:pyruvate dehydrogenase E1 component alpha subunit